MEIMEITQYVIYDDGDYLEEFENYDDAVAKLNEYREDDGLPPLLELGDVVVMVDCSEARIYGDKEWIVESKPYVQCGTELVKLHGKAGGFSTLKLKKIRGFWDDLS